MSTEQIIALIKQCLKQSTENEEKFAHLYHRATDEEKRNLAYIEMQHCAGQKIALQMLLNEIVGSTTIQQITLTEYQRACDEHRTFELGTQIVFSISEFLAYEQAYRRALLEKFHADFIAAWQRRVARIFAQCEEEQCE